MRLPPRGCPRLRASALSWVLLPFLAAPLPAQFFTQRGYLETTAVAYPQTAPNDSGRILGDALLRYEAFLKPLPNLRISTGLDARTDTHRQVDRGLDGAWQDRTRLRPALSVRRLSAAWDRGRLTVEIGKQFVRWGKADVLNPTDRFAPRDFLNVVDNEFLGITAARVTYGTQADSIDAVFAPRFTPSRLPLLGQRWAPLPAGIPIAEGQPQYPGGPQEGVRWNHIGRLAEYSLSFYQGFNHLPLLAAAIRPLPLAVELTRSYAKMRMYGGDAAIPLRAVTLKTEAAYFTSATPTADEYVLYVVQLERQAGEWFFIGGYAGQAITQRRTALDFSPERGFTRAVVARAGYTIDTNRSIALETVARQNGDGLWLKLEYTQAFGQHWRLTTGAVLIRGNPADFLGQYRRNSHGILSFRYSF